MLLPPRGHVVKYLTQLGRVVDRTRIHVCIAPTSQTPGPFRKHTQIPSTCANTLRRPFSTTTPGPKQPVLPPKPIVPVEETYKTYLKGSGPGGQKINKTSSAVQLKHIPTGIVVKSQATRSRTQNESIARRILAEKVEEKEKGLEARHKIKEARESKKKRSGEKKRRRKYRALEEEKMRSKGEQGQEPGNVDESEHDEDQISVRFEVDLPARSVESLRKEAEQVQKPP